MLESYVFLEELGERGIEEDPGTTIQFFRKLLQLSFFLSDSVILESGLQVPDVGMIPKQETVTIPLNLYASIPKCLMGWPVPSTWQNWG